MQFNVIMCENKQNYGKITKPPTLLDELMRLDVGERREIDIADYKVYSVRAAIAKLNKRLGRQAFRCTEKGMIDRCIVSRIA